MSEEVKSPVANRRLQASNGARRSVARRFGLPELLCLALLLLAALPTAAKADDPSSRPLTIETPQGLTGGPEKWVSPEGLSSTIQVMLLLTVLSLAPSILLMTTCFVRVVVVLSMLRQALGPDASAQPGAPLAGDVHHAPGHGADLEAGLRPVDRPLYEQADRAGGRLDAGAAPIRRFMRRRSSGPATPTTCSCSGSMHRPCPPRPTTTTCL